MSSLQAFFPRCQCQQAAWLSRPVFDDTRTTSADAACSSSPSLGFCHPADKRVRSSAPSRRAIGDSRSRARIIQIVRLRRLADSKSSVGNLQGLRYVLGTPSWIQTSPPLPCVHETLGESRRDCLTSKSKSNCASLNHAPHHISPEHPTHRTEICIMI